MLNFLAIFSGPVITGVSWLRNRVQCWMLSHWGRWSARVKTRTGVPDLLYSSILRRVDSMGTHMAPNCPLSRIKSRSKYLLRTDW